MVDYKEFTDENGRCVLLYSSTKELIIQKSYLSEKNCSSNVSNSTLELIKILIESKEAKHYSRHIDLIADIFVRNLHIGIYSSSIVISNKFESKGNLIPSSLCRTKAIFDNFLHDLNNEK